MICFDKADHCGISFSTCHPEYSSLCSRWSNFISSPLWNYLKCLFYFRIAALCFMLYVVLVLTYAIFVKKIYLYDFTNIISVVVCWCIEVLIIHWHQTLLGSEHRLLFKLYVLTGLMIINKTLWEVLEGVYISNVTETWTFNLWKGKKGFKKKHQGESWQIGWLGNAHETDLTWLHYTHLSY